MEELKISMNIGLSCAYCDKFLGTLEQLMAINVLNHQCLKEYENLSLDIENRKVWGVKTQSEAQSHNTGESGKSINTQDSLSHTNVKENEQESFPRYSKLSDNSVMKCPEISKESWSYEATKLLISTYKEFKSKFDSPQYNKKKVWEMISEKLKENNMSKTGDKCCEKWRNLKKTYEKTRKEQNSTGSGFTYWIFFDDLHDIFFKDPHFNPTFTISSTGSCKKRLFENTSPKDVQGIKRPFERESPEGIKEQLGNKKVTSQKVERVHLTQTEIEIRRQKRHEEKIKQKEEIFNWFKENSKKE